MFLVRRLASMSNPSSRALPRTLAIARHLSSSSPSSTNPAMSNLSNAANNAAAAREADILFDAQHTMRSYILNRPKKLNVLNRAMLANLRPVVEDWAKDDLVKLIVARGEGRAFCAGGDVAEVVLDAQNPETQEKALGFFKEECVDDSQLSNYDLVLMRIW
jgi:3-hydroxyisobutyryl-CoA hydrolase